MPFVIRPPSFVVPRLVPDQLEKADEAVVVLDLPLLSLLVLGLDPPLPPPVVALATTAEAEAIANPNPFKVPVAVLVIPSLPLPDFVFLVVDLVAMCTEPISESTSLQMTLADSDTGALEVETTEEASASVDHGAGEICFILGPRKDCIRNREAL